MLHSARCEPDRLIEANEQAAEVKGKQTAAGAKDLLFEPGDTLPQRVVRGGFWAFTLRIASRA